MLVSKKNKTLHVFFTKSKLCMSILRWYQNSLINHVWMIWAPLIGKKTQVQQREKWMVTNQPNHPSSQRFDLLNDAISSAWNWNILMRLAITVAISKKITIEFTLHTFIYRQRKRDCQDKMLTKQKAKRVSLIKANQVVTFVNA